MVSDPRVRELIGEEIDRQLTALLGDPGPRRSALLEERKGFEEKRENLARAIAGGVLTEQEAAGAITEIRAGLERVATDLHRLEATAVACYATSTASACTAGPASSAAATRVPGGDAPSPPLRAGRALTVTPRPDSR